MAVRFAMVVPVQVYRSIVAADVHMFKGFYMLAGTRVRILDLLLVLAILGGMSVPALHMTARLLTARKSGEGAP